MKEHKSETCDKCGQLLPLNCPECGKPLKVKNSRFDPAGNRIRYYYCEVAGCNGRKQTRETKK